MITRMTSTLRWFALLAAAVVLPGCLAAAAAAGAGAAIHMTDNSASGTVQGSVADVDRRTQAVLAEMGITVQERKQEPTGWEYKGSGNGMEIRVELDAGSGNTTMVKASARKNAVEWDNSYARSIVERIVQRN